MACDLIEHGVIIRKRPNNPGRSHDALGPLTKLAAGPLHAERYTMLDRGLSAHLLPVFSWPNLTLGNAPQTLPFKHGAADPKSSLRQCGL